MSSGLCVATPQFRLIAAATSGCLRGRATWARSPPSASRELAPTEPAWPVSCADAGTRSSKSPGWTDAIVGCEARTTCSTHTTRRRSVGPPLNQLSSGGPTERLRVVCVEQVVLASQPTIASVHPGDFDDLVPASAHETGQAGSVGASSLDAEGGDLAHVARPRKQPLVAAAISRNCGVATHSPELIERYRDVNVLVGVDADHDSTW